MDNIIDIDLVFLNDYEYSNNNFNILKKPIEMSYLKDNMFNYWEENNYNNKINYKKIFIIEGRLDTDSSEYIILYDNRIKNYNNVSKLILDDLNYDTKVSILYNGYILELKENITYGAIYGQVNLTNCDHGDMEILCFRSDNKRFIGRYEIINSRYSIPNLDVNSRYDIVLVDKSKKIEQQVSSYRQPFKY